MQIIRISDHSFHLGVSTFIIAFMITLECISERVRRPMHGNLPPVRSWYIENQHMCSLIFVLNHIVVLQHISADEHSVIDFIPKIFLIFDYLLLAQPVNDEPALFLTYT